MKTKASSPILRVIPVLMAMCVACLPALASDKVTGGVNPGPQTGRYVLLADQSILVQTGGIAGVHWTYSVDGQFVLTVDAKAGAASFSRVEANATDGSPTQRSLDPNQVFNMTSLAGEVLDAATLSFTGKAADGSAVRITATLEDGSAVLVAHTTPPPNSADFFVFSMDARAQRRYAGGTGEPNDPYQISCAEDLIALGNEPNDYDKHFVLTEDIDLDPNLPGSRVFDRAVIAPDVNEANASGDFDGTPFTGTLDGKGHTISHLTIRGQSHLGLLGRSGSGAEIRNLGVVDVHVTGSGDVGGVVGSNAGSMAMTYSTGAVRGGSDIGGLVGRNSGLVTCCRCTAGVDGNERVGGIVGDNSCGSVVHCSSTGAVRGTGPSIGGLVGNNTQCQCLGYPPSCGCVTGVVTASFWDMQTSGQVTSDGGTGKTTAEMQMQSTFTDAGWDFLGETKNGTADIWWINEGKDYPRLWWERQPVIDLDATSFDFQIVRGVILVDFYATWCSHCTTQAPIVEEVAERVKGRALVGKLDVDQARATAQRYGVSGIPTLILFRDGVEVRRFVGVTQADVLVSAILSAVESLGE